MITGYVRHNKSICGPKGTRESPWVSTCCVHRLYGRMHCHQGTPRNRSRRDELVWIISKNDASFERISLRREENPNGIAKRSIIDKKGGPVELYVVYFSRLHCCGQRRTVRLPVIAEQCRRNMLCERVRSSWSAQSIVELGKKKAHPSRGRKEEETDQRNGDISPYTIVNCTCTAVVLFAVFGCSCCGHIVGKLLFSID